MQVIRGSQKDKAGIVDAYIFLFIFKSGTENESTSHAACSHRLNTSVLSLT